MQQHNLLTFGFIMLWVRGRFWIGEFLLIVNLFNLIALYFRHSTYPRLIHIPIVSAPLAWTYVAILWDGAAAVHARHLPARILANIAIWGILGVGAFYVLAFKDYTMGFELAILSLGAFNTLVLGNVLTFSSSGTWSDWNCSHRCTMDLCLRHYGAPDHSVGLSQHSWSARKGQEHKAQRDRRSRPRKGATARRQLDLCCSIAV